MNTFTASNGIEINFDESIDGRVYLAGRGRHECSDTDCEESHSMMHASGSEEGTVALREFFQAERDEALGRWRYPEQPDHVVTRHACGGVRVLNEQSWSIGHFQSVKSTESSSSTLAAAARAYFAAHPEPKPWWQAATDEAWELTVNGDTGPFVTKLVPSGGVHFVAGNGSQFIPESDQITAGRRIYPAEVSA